MTYNRFANGTNAGAVFIVLMYTASLFFSEQGFVMRLQVWVRNRGAVRRNIGAKRMNLLRIDVRWVSVDIIAEGKPVL